MATLTDPPRGQEYWVATDPRFVHGIDLVTYIRSSPEFSSSFCIGVAGLFRILAQIPPSLTNLFQPTRTATLTATRMKSSSLST
jgi:hypothetical protein